MRILIASNSFPVSHMDWKAPFSIFFCEELVKRGHDVTIVTFERFGSPQEEHDLEIHRLPAISSLGEDEGLRTNSIFSWIRLAVAHRKAVKLIEVLNRKSNFDAALALWAIPAGSWLYHVGKRTDLPYLVWVLGAEIWGIGRFPVFRIIVKKVLCGAARVFADGKELCRDAASVSGGECEFLPTVRVLTEPDPKRVAELEKKRFLLFAGRLEKVKGVDWLLRAYVESGLSDISLVVIGAGTQKSELIRQARKSAASSRIHFLEPVNSRELAAHLTAARALVIPSRKESIPVIFSDAMQSGCPVVVSQAGDMGELVSRYDTGIGVTIDDTVALTQALKNIVKRGRESFRENCDNFNRDFSVSASVDLFLDRMSRII